MKWILVAFYLAICFSSSAQVYSTTSNVNAAAEAQQTYVLSPGDEILIEANHEEEIGAHPYQINAEGDIDLPLLGKQHPSGLTVEQFEKQLLSQLAAYVIHPRVVVSLTKARLERVTFAGAFRSPGIFPLQERHTLAEMLAVAGGLQPNASRTIRIRRVKWQGSIPVPEAHEDMTNRSYFVDIDLTPREDGSSEADHFLLKASDIVTAKIADPIYVSGEVTRVGPIQIEDRKELTVLQALSLSGGLTRDAAAKVVIYRPIPHSTQRQEFKVDLARVLKGNDADPVLAAKDIIYVPRATGKAVAVRALATMIGIGTPIFSGLALATR
jgi:polysaccharide biosynthesis/export protein